MERLLKDAEALTGIKYNINNLADVYSAIHAIQEQLGITGTTMKEAETTITGSLGMVKSSWQNLLTAMSGGGDLDRAINNFVYSLEKFTANIVPVIERTLFGLGQAIQRTLPMLVQTVVSALVQQIPNIVMAVYNMIVGLFKGIVLGIEALFTGGTAKATEVVKENVSGISSDASSAADNMNDVADATKKAGKEAKKSLAAFDELNILSNVGADEGEMLEASMPTISAGGGGGLLQDMSGIKQEIDAQLQAIMGVAGGALLAIGLLLLFSGNVVWGISLIVAGAVTFGVALQTLSQQDVVNPINEKLMKILAIAGTALAAIGLILLFSGVWKWGIAFLVAGAGALGVAIVATKNGNVDKEAEEMLINVMTAAGAAMLALGVILLCLGVVSGLSIGLVVAGAASLAGAIALNPQMVQQTVSNFLKDNAGLVVGISLALLVLGIILCCTGVALPLGIGLIVVGAAGLAAEVALNWETIKEKVSSAFNAVFNWIKTWGLLVLGIILTLTGNPVFGIPLIVKGAKSLTEAQDPLWTSIVDKVKEIWGKIKAFWDAHIAPVFTAEWWKNLGKKVMNGLIAGFEAGINGIIGMFEKMINWIVDGLNEISFDVPDWVPGIGGNKFGFNIPNVKFGRASIPRLAQGAVIPGGREFLAVLGDQPKRQTNIEAPLDTIKQALAEVMSDFGGNGNNQPIIIEIDGKEVFRAVRNAETRYGSRLVTGGV